MVALSMVSVALTGCQMNTGNLLSALFYYQNYFTAYFNSYVSGQCPKFFLILWSLAVEEHFYLVYPLLVSLLWRRVGLLLAVMGLLCVASLLRRVQIFLTTEDVERAVEVAGSVTDARLDSIMYGCVVAVILSIDSRSSLSTLR